MRWALADAGDGQMDTPHSHTSLISPQNTQQLQAIKEFSSDAMRWALADAGDGMDDANFETSTANAAILRLTKELTWIEEVLGPAAGEFASCSLGEGDA
jgi:leucyl-tRNA synthetase